MINAEDIIGLAEHDAELALSVLKMVGRECFFGTSVEYDELKKMLEKEVADGQKS